MWIEKRANGKYKACERYTDPLTGKTRKVAVTIEKDTRAARKAAEEALRAKIEGLSTTTSDRDPTLDEIRAAYVSRQKRATKPQTWKRDECMAKTVTDLLGKDTIVSKLSARHIIQSVEKSGKPNVTKNTYIEHIKRMLKWAYLNDYVDDVSYLQKIIPYPDNKKERIEDKFLSSDELKTLLDGMKITRWKLLTQFLALSGLRIGEAMALLDTDITTVISVTKTMDVRNGIISNSAKTDAGNREVFVQPELEAVVKDIRQYVRIDKIKTGLRSNLFFPQIDYYAYNKYLKENSKALLNHQITPHALRHTHVSLLAEAGVSLDVISRRVGHEGSSITKTIYLHITEKQKEKDKDAVRNIRIL